MRPRNKIEEPNDCSHGIPRTENQTAKVPNPYAAASTMERLTAGIAREADANDLDMGDSDLSWGDHDTSSKSSLKGLLWVALVAALVCIGIAYQERLAIYIDDLTGTDSEAVTTVKTDVNIVQAPDDHQSVLPPLETADEASEKDVISTPSLPASEDEVKHNKKQMKRSIKKPKNTRIARPILVTESENIRAGERKSEGAGLQSQNEPSKLETQSEDAETGGDRDENRSQKTAISKKTIPNPSHAPKIDDNPF